MDTIKPKPRPAKLTGSEIEVLIAMVDERLAGGSTNWRDAVGLTEQEADEQFALAESAVRKLAGRKT